MRRLHGPLTALALAVLASPAGAAESTRLASSGDPGNPFDIEFGARWDRTIERSTITRERAAATDPATMPGGLITEAERLRYVRTRNAIVPRVAIGLYKDLELHAEMPYVLGDDREWRYGVSSGKPTGPDPADPQSVEGNLIDADGQPCTVTPCPIFVLSPDPATVFHGGRAGDLEIGLAWAVFHDQKDDTKPYWLVGVDVTVPTAALYAPGKDRTADTWDSPFRLKAKPGPFGERIWKVDLHTAFSKRYGYIDPYVKAHAQLAFKSASTYSNCDAVNEATAATVPQMNSQAVGACKAWGSEADAKLPFVAGITLGTEVIPFEDVAEGQRLTFDFRVFSELTSKSRFYNELTDLTGKLHMTEGYMEMGALAALYLRASAYVVLHAQASIATRTAHYLTGESLGKGSSWPTAAERSADPTVVNPNFDWRYDAPGRRFRVSETSVFELSFGGKLQF